MAKKAPAKPRAKRKPRPKKPVDAVIIDAIRQHIAEDPFDNAPPKSIAWRSWLGSGVNAVALIAVGTVAGVYAAGGIEVGPGPKNDAVATVFRTQETAFRDLSAERAKALRAGQIASESASVDWMSARFLPKAEAAWTPLLTAEKAAFGGERWTAEKEASVIERYAR